MPTVLTRIGSGQAYVHPVRIGNETIGYRNLIIPQDEMTFTEPLDHYADQQSLDGTRMWRHVFQTKEWQRWDFPVIIRNYDSPDELTWWRALATNPGQTLSFWDHRAKGVYTSGTYNGVAFPLSVKVDVGWDAQLQVRNHDSFTYNGTLKLRLA